jgi:rod shape-determining protein MreC
MDLPSRAKVWIVENLVKHIALVRENHTLREQQTLLRARLQKLSALEYEVVRLCKLLNSLSRLRRERVLIAGLLAVDLDPYKQHMVIYKGARHGIYEGQPVLDAHGMMGQITNVTPISATPSCFPTPTMRCRWR